MSLPIVKLTRLSDVIQVPSEQYRLRVRHSVYRDYLQSDPFCQAQRACRPYPSGFGKSRLAGHWHRDCHCHRMLLFPSERLRPRSQVRNPSAVAAPVCFRSHSPCQAPLHTWCVHTSASDGGDCPCPCGRLTGRALKLGGSLLPHLAKHYFGIYGADPKDVETRHARSYADLERLQLAMDREDSGLSFGPPPLSRQPSQPVSDGRESHLAPQPLPAPSPPGNNASCAATASSSARGAPQPQEIPSNTNGICCQTSTEMQPRGETCSARQNPTPLSPEVPDAEPGAQRSGSTSDDEGIRPLASFPSSSAAVGSNGDNASTLGISIENVVLSVENGEDIDAASIIAGTEAETNAAHTWAITDDWDISGLMGVQQDISPGALLDEVPLTDDNAPTGYSAGLPEVHRRLQVCMDLMDAANAQIKLAEKVVVRLVPSHSEMPHSGVALCVADVPVCTEWAVWLCLVEVHSLLGLRQPCAAGGAAR